MLSAAFQIVELIQPDPLLRAHGVAFIGEHMIPREHWRRVRPKPGAYLSIRLLPSSGGGARIAAMIGIAVLAIAATVLTAGAAAPLDAMLFTGAASMAGALAGAAVSVAGTLLLNTLLPPPLPQMAKNYGNESPTYAITGARNQARPWEKLAFLCGRFKLTPAYAALPYREVVGGDIYWRAIFALAHGPIVVDEVRVGKTLIGDFQGVESEFRRGYWSMPDKGWWDASSGAFPSNPAFGDTWTVSVAGTAGGYTYAAGRTITFNGLFPVTSADAWDRDAGKAFSLYPNDVYEDALAAAVKHATPVIRTSQANADELAIELIFDRGLVHIENKPPGKRSDSSTSIRIEQSPTGQNVWTTVLTRTITGRQTTPLYWGWRWKPADFGTADANRQYDVRITKTSGDHDEDRNFGNFSWYALRTITTGNPVPVPAMAMMAVRIKASGQLSGALDEFNVVARSIVRDWDANSGTWVWRPSSQPAAHFRHVLQHPSRQADHAAVQRELGAARRSDEWRHVLPGQERAFDAVEMVTPTRTDTGWEFPPLHVGLVVAPGWLIHAERATAAVLARYREDQSIKRRILSFWRHRDLADG